MCMFFFFLSRGYNLFTAHFKDLVLKKQDTNGKEYADEFF